MTTATTTGLITEVFKGRIDNGQTRTFDIVALPGWRSSYVEVTALVQDVNSDTNRQFFHAEYGWFREWDKAPQHLLLSQVEKNTGIYKIDTIAEENVIKVRLVQNGFDTATYFKIVVNYMLVDVE